MISGVWDGGIFVVNRDQVGGAEYRGNVYNRAYGDTIPHARLHNPHTRCSFRGVSVALEPMDQGALVPTLAVI